MNAEIIEGVRERATSRSSRRSASTIDGERYNINADTAAGAVASAARSDRIIVVTDVPGILRTIDGEKRVAARPEDGGSDEMIEPAEISGGMIPKVKSAVQCIQGRVREVVIIGGAEPGAFARAVREGGVGTRIVKA